MTRALADQEGSIRLPVHVSDQVRRVMRTRRTLAQKLELQADDCRDLAEVGLAGEARQELLEIVEDAVSLAAWSRAATASTATWSRTADAEETDVVVAETFRAEELMRAWSHRAAPA